MTSSGWYSFNAPCCHHRGHRPDKRGRGGIMLDGDNWTYNCFNCHYKCSFILGRTINKKTRDFLMWQGVDQSTITKWNFESLKHKDLIEYVTKKKKSKIPKFKETELPSNAELLDPNNHNHTQFINYLEDRGFKREEYAFMATPSDSGRNGNRIIIPYTFENKIVGYTSRYLDNKTPKYIKEQPQGYVFGYDLQNEDWECCIVVEGIFDALAINGCALGHDTISSTQANILRSLNKKVIVVPDRDEAGLTICNRALELGFHVSLPNWENSIKDVNDAVLKYGRLPAIMSIMEAASNNKVKVEMMRRKLVKGI